jgi:hypothetical protein
MSLTSNQSLLSSFFADEEDEDDYLVDKSRKASSVTQRFLHKIKKEPLDNEDSMDAGTLVTPSSSQDEYGSTFLVPPSPGPSNKRKSPSSDSQGSSGSGRRTQKRQRRTTIKRERASGTGGSKLKKSSTWSMMSMPDKASSIKTYVTRYGTQTVSKELRCIRKNAGQAISKLETLVESASNQLDVLSFFLDEKSKGKSSVTSVTSSSSAAPNAVQSLMKDIACIREEVLPNLSSFVHQDVQSIREIEEDVEGFVAEVSEQCDDILYGHPSAAPEEYICTSMFTVYQSAKAHGRRKSSGASRIPPSTLRTGTLASSMMQSGGKGTLYRQAGNTRNGRSGMGKKGSSDRRRRSTGTCPLKNEFFRNVENLLG